MTPTYVVMGCAPTAPPQPLGHFGEAFCFDEMVDGKRRKHGAISVDLGFDKQSGATDAIETDNLLGVAIGVY